MFKINDTNLKAVINYFLNFKNGEFENKALFG